MTITTAGGPTYLGLLPVGTDAVTDGRSRVSRWARIHLHWWMGLLAPIVDRGRALGISRAAPISMVLALASLVVTGLVRIASPARHQLAGILSYRGQDLYDGQLWKLVSGGLLAQSWSQWLWTLFVAVIVFAALEVRVGGPMLLAAAFAGQVISTVAVAWLAPLIGHAEQLAHEDVGTSCLVVAAAAALAWVRRSLLLTGVILSSLLVDGFLSAPATAVEHCVAVATGALVMVAAPAGRRPRDRVPASARAFMVAALTAASGTEGR